MSNGYQATSSTTPLSNGYQATCSTTPLSNGYQATSSTTPLSNGYQATSSTMHLNNGYQATSSTMHLGNGCQATPSATPLGNGYQATSSLWSNAAGPIGFQTESLLRQPSTRSAVEQVNGNVSSRVRSIVDPALQTQPAPYVSSGVHRTSISTASSSPTPRILPAPTPREPSTTPAIAVTTASTGPPTTPPAITVTPSTPAKGPGPGEAAKATVPLHGDLLCAPEAPPSDGGGTPKNLSFTSDSFETLYLKGLAADVAAYDPIVQPKAKQQRLLSPAAPPTHAPRKLSFTDRSFHFLHQRGVFADQIPVYADEVRAQPQPPQPPSPQLQPMRPPRKLSFTDLSFDWLHRKGLMADEPQFLTPSEFVHVPL
uniref:Uncharacterized protein n=1 Tax=Eutreptiella gymnastica TaxID=73025 RepID=A0A7S4G0W3_9EUGL